MVRLNSHFVICKFVVILGLFLFFPLPVVSSMNYSNMGLYWDLQEGQMVNCTLTWYYDFGSISSQINTPILGNITELDDLGEESASLPSGLMTFYWQDGSEIEYDSTSSWRHKIRSLILPLGNWSLLALLLEINYTIMEENDTSITFYSLFVPSPDLPSTWRNQTISKSDGVFLSIDLGYVYPNETITHFVTISRNGSIYTPTRTTTGFGSLVLTPELLVMVTIGSMMVIATIVFTKSRAIPAPSKAI